MAAIVAYIVGYTVVFEQRYRLIATDIFGSARLQLVGPSSNFTLLPNQTAYCLTEGGGAQPRPGNPPMVKLPCRYLNTYGMVYPEEEASAMLIATRITEVRGAGRREGLRARNDVPDDADQQHAPPGLRRLPPADLWVHRGVCRLTMGW